MRGARPRVARVAASRTPRRRQLDVGERHRRLRLREPKPRCAARPAAAARSSSGRAARPRSPSPSACAPVDIYSHWTQCPTHPASSPAAPGRADQVASRWREDAYEPPAAPDARRPTRRSPRSQDRGSPAHDGLAARLAGYEAGDGRLAARAAADALVAAAGARGRQRVARGAVRRARRRRALAGRPARRVGRDRGPAAGRSAPAARSRSARTRCETLGARARGGVVGRRPSGSSVEALVVAAQPAGDAGRPGVAARRAPRSRATPSTTSTPGGRADPGAWPDGRRPGAAPRWRRSSRERAHQLPRRCSTCRYTHSAIYAVLLWAADPGRAGRRRTCSAGRTASAGSSCRCSCLDAVRRRVIPLWLGVMVAVVGGVGPFAGSIGFVPARNARSVTEQAPRTPRKGI